ncbi:helix-turn-helix domain-containing protein [Streptomyces johnsoniae]|uniref:Helix-turn-helix domain-containing protein n=1 Tax=Streptomyces johnsoniae TaxID=3075532 RepID=A0ABU2SBK2_9ACTN|nr:helix-turn-helix domain-containing protein [Streptomyces sp. DSM 41886]MDT0446352.1 helix-turn-helix domain-containing protein [Streptomyces sp. DSM 41886]
MGSELEGVEALLAEARRAAAMPDPAERLRLRQAAGLSRPQVAGAVGVEPQTVANWETGRTEPAPPARGKYLRLLEGLAEIHPAPKEPRPATHEPAPQVAADLPRQPIPPAAPQRPAESPAARAARAGHERHQERRRTTSAEQTREELGQLVTGAVHEELTKAGGDAESAMDKLAKRAIPDVMRLFAATRKTARYEYTAYPALPDILRKPRKDAPDLIWEARPSWRHPGHRRHPDGDLHVTALDANAAYLSAMKTWLPIGRLEHSATGEHDKKRSGVHLITPPPWHHPELPSPLGDREEAGPLWITEATLRLLLRLAGPKHRLLDPPVIHESWTSSATENFLDALRQILATVRADALASRDDVTAHYIKAMYSKFVSTMGESHNNRDITRPDWMHIVRAQAFANLWGRAFKAHQAGLTVISAMGTDELHLAGDWHTVFTEGRGLSEMKVKTDRDGAPVHYTVARSSR